jgi:hypothetical protein
MTTLRVKRCSSANSRGARRRSTGEINCDAMMKGDRDTGHALPLLYDLCETGRHHAARSKERRKDMPPQAVVPTWSTPLWEGSTRVLLTVPFVSERDLNPEIQPVKRAIGLLGPKAIGPRIRLELPEPPDVDCSVHRERPSLPPPTPFPASPTILAWSLAGSRPAPRTIPVAEFSFSDRTVPRLLFLARPAGDNRLAPGLHMRFHP